jgi:hypothetical protein
MPMFIKLSPKHTKCVTEVEIWGNGDYKIERFIGWRYGTVLVSDKSDLNFINKRTANKLLDVCLTDHLSILDQTLQVSFSEDLTFDENLPAGEKKKIEHEFSKYSEDAFYNNGWEIIETKLYFMGEIDISLTNKNTL